METEIDREEKITCEHCNRAGCRSCDDDGFDCDVCGARAGWDEGGFDWGGSGDQKWCENCCPEYLQ